MSEPSDRVERIERTRRNARAALLDRLDGGVFRGQLSSSALSTATAVIALELLRVATEEAALDAPVRAGLDWLLAHANDDGGFGDTIDSPSNIATTALVWSALACDDSAEAPRVASRAEHWITDHAGGADAACLSRALAKRYGDDLTFSVPILTACALTGRLGDGAIPWRSFPALPFELASLPRRWFARLGLPVVSYALPALIALGQVRHRRAPSRNPFARAARALTTARTLRVLDQVQPESGGFLEAAPLTSFVLMSLVGVDQCEHQVARRAAAFLLDTVRANGSWPIDTNLDTWTTTLATKALRGDFMPQDTDATLRYLLDGQGKSEHEYTLAAAGAWAWTDLSGGVPDGDDTPGALLALSALAPDDTEVIQAATEGVRWLVDLQNRDGGVPTFCRGYGKLPFDESAPDLTAHAIRAWDAWRDRLADSLGVRVDRARADAVAFLLRSQREDGTWIPLWFGNQSTPDETNPVYGTAAVMRALSNDVDPDVRRAVARAGRWLASAQAEDGGFGGAPGITPTVEETAVALEALAGVLAPDAPILTAAALHLADRTDDGTRFPAAPVGLYFARLWYAEELYPLVFTVSALSRIARPSAPE